MKQKRQDYKKSLFYRSETRRIATELDTIFQKAKTEEAKARSKRKSKVISNEKDAEALVPKLSLTSLLAPHDEPDKKAPSLLAIKKDAIKSQVYEFGSNDAASTSTTGWTAPYVFS